MLGKKGMSKRSLRVPWIVTDRNSMSKYLDSGGEMPPLIAWREHSTVRQTRGKEFVQYALLGLRGVDFPPLKGTNDTFRRRTDAWN
jgi:hypothetical protein